MTPLSQRFALRKISQLGLAPRTRLARFALLFLGLELLLAGIQQVMVRAGGAAGAQELDGWLSALTVTNLILFTILGLRWIRQVLMWRLRNRLLVTYVFIGVIPVLLILCMAAITGYLFANRLATHLATSALESEGVALEAVNSAVASELVSRLPARLPVASLQLQSVALVAQRFPEAEIGAWINGSPRLLHSPLPASSVSFAAPPPVALTEHPRAMVLDHGQAFVRSVAAAK